MPKKLPAFQFYTGDWLKDPAVRSVSLAARGLWMDMLCLMHESPRRGFLQHATGKPVSAEQIARMTGCSTDEVSRLLQELKDAGVFSCTEHGVIYSRRMVRDEERRRRCAEAGKKGGGNPKLRNGGETAPPEERFKGMSKGMPKGVPKPNPPPSSSISSSISSSEIHTHPLTPSLSDQTVKLRLPRGWECVREDLEEWLEYLKKHGKYPIDPDLQVVSICRMFSDPEDLQGAVRSAIANGWVTLRPSMAEKSPPVASRQPPEPEPLSVTVERIRRQREVEAAANPKPR